MNTSNLYSALTSKDFMHVGPATASKLLSAFSPQELLTHLECRNSEALRTIKGVSEVAILGLYRGYMILKKKVELACFLDNLALPNEIVDKLYAVWGSQAIDKFKRNPYQLLFVLPWEIVDPIGRSLGSSSHPCRLVGAVENCLYEDFEQGKNTCIPPQLLLDKVSNLLGCDITVAEQAVKYSLKVRSVIEHAGLLQLAAAYSFERHIEHLLSQNRKYDISAEVVRHYIRSGKYLTLTEEQEDVVIAALQNRYSAFYGRGGRGKTFTLSAICAAATDLLGRKSRAVQPVLCAVAAKACHRIRKETGHEARTVAGIIYSTERRDLDNKIVIVDEASMLSLSDAFHLIRKIPESSRLIFLGDYGQLPSVDAGRFFFDLITRKAIPSIELSINQRQDQKTDLQLEEILTGTLPELEDYRTGVQSGLYRSVVKDVYAAEEEAMKIYAQFDGKAQVISPLKKNVGGSDSINRLIHEKHYDRSGFSKGTPVIFTKNMVVAIRSRDRLIRLTNGSMGEISDVLALSPAPGDPYLMVDFEFEGKVALTCSEATDYLEMAYCMSCHKSQGSDWDTVIVVLPKSNLLVDRNMIYSALSRCKIRAILIYYDHTFIANRVKAPAAHERRRSALFGGSNVYYHNNKSNRC